jgi:hypothetical protein
LFLSVRSEALQKPENSRVRRSAYLAPVGADGDPPAYSGSLPDLRRVTGRLETAVPSRQRQNA